MLSRLVAKYTTSIIAGTCVSKYVMITIIVSQNQQFVDNSRRNSAAVRKQIKRYIIPVTFEYEIYEFSPLSLQEVFYVHTFADELSDS